MNLIRINQQKPASDTISMAVRQILEKQIIIHPTETVYGFAGLYNSLPALQQILELKGRSESKPFSIMTESIASILEISGHVGNKWLEWLLNELLPAPITILVPRNRNLDLVYWNQFQLLGFRFPKHRLSLDLISGVKQPIVTTSANISGEPPADSIQNINPQLLEKVPLILDGGKTSAKIPSTIIRVDLHKKKINFMREGAILRETIENRFPDLF